MLNKAKPKRLKCKGYDLGDDIVANSTVSVISSLSGKLPLDTGVARFGKALSQGIPVLSIFALVGMMIAANSFMPILNNNASFAAGMADEHGCVTSVSYGNEASLEIWDELTQQCVNLTTPDCGSGYTWNATDKKCQMPLVDATPSVSLIIDNNTIHDTIYAGRGTTAYASHTININAKRIESYQLTLTPTKTLTGPSTIGNASGQKGASLNANTWGYGWGATTTADSDLTYNSLASTVTLNGDDVSNNSVEFSRKLAFAAKFGDNADDGTYSASINLALTVTPQKIVAWNDMVYMQDMTAAACESVPVGTEKTLKDIRDQSSYTIKKLNDSQCWMTQNLRIVNKSISSTDSNMASGSFTIPASSTTGFSSDTTSYAYYGNDTTKGAYYSWCAATAGSCSSATSAGVNASSSICPKGWHLPVSGTGTTGTNTGATSDTKNDFMVLAGKTSTSSFTDASLVSGTNITLGGVTWPFSGYYANSASSNTAGTNGYYWSRTASKPTTAYALDTNNSGYFHLAAGNFGRYYGFSVRCVAYSS